MGYTHNLDVSKFMKGGGFDADIRPFWLSDCEIALSREDLDSYDKPVEDRTYDIFILNIATGNILLIHKGLNPAPFYIEKRGNIVMAETKLNIVSWELTAHNGPIIRMFYKRYYTTNGRSATIANCGDILRYSGMICLHHDGIVKKISTGMSQPFSFYDNGCIVLVGNSVQVYKNNNGNIAFTQHGAVGEILGLITANGRTKCYCLSTGELQEISSDGIARYAAIVHRLDDETSQITSELPTLTHKKQYGVYFEPSRFRIDYYDDRRWLPTISLYEIGTRSPVELYETHCISRKRNFDICDDILALFTGMLQLRNWPYRLFGFHWRLASGAHQMLRGQLIRMFRIANLPLPIVQIIFAMAWPMRRWGQICG